MAALNVSSDPDKLDVLMIHQYLTHSQWAQGISLDTVKRSIKNSLCFGLYQGEQQIGFARIISDYATFAYLGDVFILEPYRGLGGSHLLLDAILSHPDLQGLRRYLLVTSTAADLYARYGFSSVPNPEGYMQIYQPYQ